jgi:WD40 repeat protein
MDFTVRPLQAIRAAFLAYMSVISTMSLSAEELKLRTTLKTENREISIIAVAPDGRTLGYADGSTIKLWDLRTSKQIATLRAHKMPVVWASFSADGKELGTACNLLRKLWDVSTFQEKRALPRQMKWVEATCFSNDLKTLAMPTPEGRIRLWSTDSGNELRTLGAGRLLFVGAMTFSCDDRMLASRGNQFNTVVSAPKPQDKGSLELWDLSSGELIVVFREHFVPEPRTIAISWDREHIAATTLDKTVKVWKMRSGREHICLKTSSYSRCVSFSRDGNRIVFEDEGDVTLYDIVKAQELGKVKAHSNAALAVAFTPDGKVLATGGSDYTIKIWDVYGEKTGKGN